jgi:zinc transporter, ZIP family
MLIAYFSQLDPVWQALLATTLTWLMTALGASVVFFFKTISRKWMDFMLGFTGGIMLAAAFWSLLIPAIQMSVPQWGNHGSWIPVSIGFFTGALFIFGMDKILPHIHVHANATEGVKTQWNKSVLMVLAITLHNIPEGLAIGVMFGAAANGFQNVELGSAIALTIGIAIQNLPEGIAVAAPLRRMGMSRKKSFFWGQLSAAVEPIGGVIGALAVISIQPLLPFALSFAAGAMIFVVVEEVIPESQQDRFKDLASLGFIIGFMVMMALDTGLQ